MRAPAPATPDALLLHTGCIWCTPNPCAESTANSQGHQTRATGCTLSVRCSSVKNSSRALANITQHGRANSILPVSGASIRCARLTRARVRHLTGRTRAASSAANTCVQCCQHLRLVRNRKYTLNFLTSSTGGREEPKPISTLGTPPPLQSVPTPTSLHHHVQVC